MRTSLSAAGRPRAAACGAAARCSSSARGLPRSTRCAPHGAAPRRGRAPPRVNPRDDVQPVPPAPLCTSMDEGDLARDADWIAGAVALWLDEEWTPQGVHQDLGRAAGDAYARIRAGGEDEMGGLLLGLSNELMGFGNWREAFVGPFDVANKVVEMLMMREGTDVCCTTDADRERLDRLSASD